MIPDLKTAAIVAVIVGVVAFGGGWTANGWRLTSQYTAEKLEASQEAAKALADMTDERDKLAGKLSASNDAHANELRAAQNETNRLRDRLANDSGGLRINALCPPAPPVTPAASGTRVDTGTGEPNLVQLLDKLISPYETESTEQAPSSPPAKTN